MAELAVVRMFGCSESPDVQPVDLFELLERMFFFVRIEVRIFRFAGLKSFIFLRSSLASRVLHHSDVLFDVSTNIQIISILINTIKYSHIHSLSSINWAVEVLSINRCFWFFFFKQ